MQQLLPNRNAVGKVTAGNFQSKKRRCKNISYNSNEDYIMEIEKKLMRKYRLGFSQLHKTLVYNAAQQSLDYPFVGNGY